MSNCNYDKPKSRLNYNISYSHSSLPNPLVMTKHLTRQLKKLKIIKFFKSSRKEYNLGPMDHIMSIYRKGFKSRSKETLYDFDNVINNGFGVHNNQTYYTLRFSLTPEVIRDPSY